MNKVRITKNQADTVIEKLKAAKDVLSYILDDQHTSIESIEGAKNVITIINSVISSFDRFPVYDDSKMTDEQLALAVLPYINDEEWVSKQLGGGVK